MKIEEQRLEIAKFCGWIEIYRPELYEFNYRNTITDELSNELPDYLNDLNAIHEAEKKIINTLMWGDYYRWLVCVMDVDSESDNGCQSNIMIHASASQRCEALLKTIEKWKD